MAIEHSTQEAVNRRTIAGTSVVAVEGDAGAIRDARMRLGLTRKQYAKQLGVRPCTLWRWETGRAAPKRRYTHNARFFERLNLLTCYWGGFLAADGNIDPENGALVVGLAACDLAHLQLFKSDIEFTGPISYVERTNSYRLQMYSARRVIKNLTRFGVVPAKSLILQPPRLIDPGLIKAFLVGFIDGDGHIRKTKSDGLWLLDIYSGSPLMTEWVRAQLETLYDLPHKMIYNYGRGATYRLEGSRALRVLRDLKCVGERRLERKWKNIPLQGQLTFHERWE